MHAKLSIQTRSGMKSFSAEWATDTDPQGLSSRSEEAKERASDLYLKPSLGPSKLGALADPLPQRAPHIWFFRDTIIFLNTFSKCLFFFFCQSHGFIYLMRKLVRRPYSMFTSDHCLMDFYKLACICGSICVRMHVNVHSFILVCNMLSMDVDIHSPLLYVKYIYM